MTDDEYREFDIFGEQKPSLIKGTLIDGKKQDIYIGETGLIEEISDKYSGKFGEPEFIIDGSESAASPAFAN
ncbi:MAG: hypothetical protein J5703_02895, partial [Methanomicrobium sp.]|nr:hypothetical protein [Methanomicrobium sp.]